MYTILMIDKKVVVGRIVNNKLVVNACIFFSSNKDSTTFVGNVVGVKKVKLESMCCLYIYKY